MDGKVYTVIDEALCVECGECVRVCPSGTITMVDGVARVTGDRSLACGHCLAVRPSGAIEVGAIDEQALEFATFKGDDAWLPHGQFDVALLVKLMRSRRSCRNYTDRPVDRAAIEDLVKVGITAPSGTNSQLWTFTILPTRSAMEAFGFRIGDFFRSLNRKAEKAWLRGLLKVLGRGELEAYYREHYPRVKQRLADWERSGIDPLFHGATAGIIVGMRPGASCPAEDALLATQNILLAAHAMGLGTCLIGYAVSAVKNDPGIKDFLGIDRRETVYAVIALGHPDETYLRAAGRRKVEPRYFEG